MHSPNRTITPGQGTILGRDGTGGGGGKQRAVRGRLEKRENPPNKKDPLQTLTRMESWNPRKRGVQCAKVCAARPYLDGHAFYARQDHVPPQRNGLQCRDQNQVGMIDAYEVEHSTVLLHSRTNQKYSDCNAALRIAAQCVHRGARASVQK